MLRFFHPMDSTILHTKATKPHSTGLNLNSILHFNMRPLSLTFILAGLFLAPIVHSTSPSRMVSSAPVRDFSLPRFGKDGYKIWNLKGSQGSYISPERIDVVDMTLCTFSGDERMEVETCMESPQASISIQENQASSEETLNINNLSYHIEGKEWIWDGNLKKIIIQRDVHVTFNQELNDRLKK